MNANELADSGIEIANDKQIAAMSLDKLIEYLNGWYSSAAPRKAATMLRNLQDLIERQAGEYESLVRIKENLQAKNEALKAENKFFKDLMGDVEILRKAQEKWILNQ